MSVGSGRVASVVNWETANGVTTTCVVCKQCAIHYCVRHGAECAVLSKDTFIHIDGLAAMM